MGTIVSHKQYVILLGKKMKVEPCSLYVQSREGNAVLFTRDFMEWIGLNTDDQMWFEYFNKLVSLGSRGITVYIHWHVRDEFKTVYYPVLSTESSQYGHVVGSNTVLVLNKVVKGMDG